METFEFILLLEDDKGLTTKQNVIASDSMAAVNDNVPGTWCKMDKNDIPRGIYGVGTYSYKNGYVLVKKLTEFVIGLGEFMDNLTSEFELYKIANDFRFYFLHHLSQKAVENSWRSSINVQTNLSQNAFYFSQQVKYDTLRVIEGVYRDIQNVLKSLRDFGFEFDVKTVKKGYSIEVTNISWKD